MVLTPSHLLTAADRPADAPNTDVASSAADILAAARAADAVFQRNLAILYQNLASDDQATVIAALTDLGHQGVQEAVPRILPYADFYNQPSPVIIAASESLANLQAVNATASLEKLLQHSDPDVRAAGQKALVRLQAMGAALYRTKSSDTDDAIRASAITSLGVLADADSGQILIKALRYDSRPHVRRMAAIGLGRLGDATLADPLIEGLSDSNPDVRAYCAASLTQLNVKRAIPYLLMGMESNIAANAMNRALITLSGQDFGFQSTDNVLDRMHAIEAGYGWWAANAKTLAE